MGNNNYEIDWLCVFLFGLVLILGLMGICAFIDDTYLKPQASENANQICKEQGYDFYESFERIGLFSTTPIAIKCKYVENYKEMNIALRQTYGGSSDDSNDLGKLNDLSKVK